MKVTNVIQISVSVYFSEEEIIGYFTVKKCSELLSCEVVKCRHKFLTSKTRLNN